MAEQITQKGAVSVPRKSVKKICEISGNKKAENFPQIAQMAAEKRSAQISEICGSKLAPELAGLSRLQLSIK